MKLCYPSAFVVTLITRNIIWTKSYTTAIKKTLGHWVVCPSKSSLSHVDFRAAWLLNYGSLYSQSGFFFFFLFLFKPPKRVASEFLCLSAPLQSFPWIPFVAIDNCGDWVEKTVHMIEWKNGFCIVKASRLLVQITVTEMKKEIYRYSMLAGINDGGKERTGQKGGKQKRKKS